MRTTVLLPKIYLTSEPVKKEQVARIDKSGLVAALEQAFSERSPAEASIAEDPTSLWPHGAAYHSIRVLAIVVFGPPVKLFNAVNWTLLAALVTDLS